MGILNITPDSFSDGGELMNDGKINLNKILARAELMVSAGADFLDIGGESTRPGAVAVAEVEELERVAPVVEALAQRFDVVLSVDTSSPQVISVCAGLGAGLINDVRSLSTPEAMDAAARSGLPVCIMHMQGTPGTMQVDPHYVDVVREVLQYLRAKVTLCNKAGITGDRIIVDPGFGFGKALPHNLNLLNHLESFRALDLPLLVGLSRKRMLGFITGKSEKDRVAAGIAAAVIAVMKGACIVRTHDVPETVDALKICHSVRSSESALC
ncbi:MAG: dihydropteroate synthase [Pseudomonadota bacterium]